MQCHRHIIDVLLITNFWYRRGSGLLLGTVDEGKIRHVYTQNGWLPKLIYHGWDLSLPKVLYLIAWYN